MGFLEKMKDRLVYVDAAPFICFMEKNLSYEKQLDAFFLLLDQG